MPRMTGGEAVVRSLVRAGVEIIFGLPGVQMYGLTIAIRDDPGIRMITPRSEFALTYMADGYARTGNRIAPVMVVPGPGVYNAAGGLSTAYSTSSPVMLIAGQTPRDTIGGNTGALHEVNDQMDTIKPITKWQGRSPSFPSGAEASARRMCSSSQGLSPSSSSWATIAVGYQFRHTSGQRASNKSSAYLCISLWS